VEDELPRREEERRRRREVVPLLDLTTKTGAGAW
jgi:hypothetical protein